MLKNRISGGDVKCNRSAFFSENASAFLFVESILCSTGDARALSLSQPFVLCLPAKTRSSEMRRWVSLQNQRSEEFYYNYSLSE